MTFLLATTTDGFLWDEEDTIMFNNLSANSTLRVWRKKRRRRRRRKIFKKIHYNQSPKSILNLIKNCKNGKLIQLPVVGEKTKAQ